MEILRGLGNSGTASVTVERAGVVQQISVDAAQVAALSESTPAPGAAPAGAPPAGAAPADAPPAAEPPPKPE